MMIVCYTKAHTVVACSRSQSRRTNIERERAVYMILLDSLSSPSSSSFLPSFLSFFLSFILYFADDDLVLYLVEQNQSSGDFSHFPFCMYIY